MKKSWSDFFIAISICNTVVVVDSMKSTDSAGSNYNEAFDDSTLSAAEIDHDIDGRTSAKVSNGCLDCHVTGEAQASSEPFVMYKNRNVADDPKTQIRNNGSLKQSNHMCSTHYKATGRTPKLGKLYESRPKYEAESPDEEALVKGAYFFGYILKARFPGSVRLRHPNGSVSDFELLHTLGFDSSRKRMSIIVRNPDGEIQLFCKGADTVIMSRLDNYSGMCFFHSCFILASLFSFEFHLFIYIYLWVALQPMCFR